jgi:hypothetical protein
MAVDFGSITSILDGVDKILTISTSGAQTTLPPFLILTGIPKRNGLNVDLIYQTILKKKQQFGLPVGALPSSNADDQKPSPDEMMELVRIQAMVEAIQLTAKVIVEIPAGTAITGSGISPSGPVTVFGVTTMLTKGYGQIF